MTDAPLVQTTPCHDDHNKKILETLQAIWAEMRAMRTDFKTDIRQVLRILQNQGADDVSALQMEGQNTARPGRGSHNR